jgi:iron complex transport system substrate-binding protein
MMRALLLVLGCLGWVSPGVAAEARRIVTVGASITEATYALGAGAEVVGVDRSSRHPDAATRLPDVGLYSRLSTEGLLSLRPTHVLVTTEAGPAAALEQLRAAGTRVVVIEGEDSVSGALSRIRGVGAALGLEARAAALVADLESGLAAVKPASGKPRVLTLYARGVRTLLVAGDDTGVADLVARAGGLNAAGGVRGFARLTPEALVAASPDVVLVSSGGLASLGGVDGLLAIPGLALTPAGRHRRVVSLDDALVFGFGPRVVDGLSRLAEALAAPAMQRGPAE